MKPALPCFVRLLPFLLLSLGCSSSDVSEEMSTDSPSTGGTSGMEDASTEPPAKPDAGTSNDDEPAGIDDPETPGHDARGGVSCGEDYPACSLSSQSCCVTGFGAGGTQCVDGASCPTGNPTPCDGPEECGEGESCCVLPADGVTVCKAGCGEGGGFEVVLCHDDAHCAAGLNCTRSEVFTWWGTCN